MASPRQAARTLDSALLAPLSDAVDGIRDGAAASRSLGDGGVVSLDIEARRRRGRGAVSNRSGRFERQTREIDADALSTEDARPIPTDVTIETARKIITENTSPDISFDLSVNPYRGCEHGCVYCFARPTHAYQGLSAGLDFETKLFAKTNAADLLEHELADPRYRPKVIALGANTDPYQPIEKRFGITRRILEVLDRASHPVGIVTKSALVTRDLDILASMAERNLVRVGVSLTTMDAKLARVMEPRAATPSRRLKTIEALARAGIPVTVMTAPVVPAINDHEVERLLDAASAAGAVSAGYVLIRLPLEVAPLFREWLAEHFPDRKDKVMAILRGMRGGQDYDATWGRRMTGSGPYAWALGRRFELAAKRLGLNGRRAPLSLDRFVRPVPKGGQFALL